LLKSILVIDDEQEVRNTLSAILEDEGYSVETAEKGRTAIEKCRKKPFDLALIDINLPDMNGTELAHQLKYLQPRMLRIIITGYPTVENAIKAVNQKTDGYILKPIKVPELLETVRRCLNEEQEKYFQIFREVVRFKEQKESSKFNSQDEVPPTIQEKKESLAPPINDVQEEKECFTIPSGCKMHLGYLSERGTNIPVPEFCYTCPEILQCMQKKDAELQTKCV
jgi:DNA-binding NtrC family response regulator